MKQLTKLKYLQNQLAITQMHVMRCHAELVSGAYRTRKISHGTEGREFTDDEKARHVVDTMKRHIQYMNELLDEQAKVSGYPEGLVNERHR